MHKLAVVTAFILLPCALLAQEPAPAPTGPLEIPRLNNPVAESVYRAESTVADQTDVAVTIYNNNLALVRDRRKTVLMPGEIMLRFADVSQQIKPETVSLKSLTEPDALRIIEQNYEFDLMSPAKLMEKYVGKTVRLVNFSTEIGFDEKDAKLLSVNEGPIYQIDGDIYLGHPGNVALPEIPANLIAKPSLIWLLQNDGTDHDVEVSYLTGGLGWQADYVLTLNREETLIDVEGWVTLTNSSGAQYTNAMLKVVAGEVNVVPKVEEKLRGGGAMMKAAAVAPMREETFAEYHLYTLPRRTTIKQNESKQVTLLTASGVGVTKIYELRGNEGYYMQRIPPQPEQSVTVFLKFANKQENHLGMPLPGGVMRVYQEDQEGMLQFAGEDRIKHTPKDEDVKLKLGNAFDVVGERVQTDWNRIADNVYESEFKITLRNHKQQDIQVEVVEPMTGDWRILSKSHEFVKRDSRTAVFTVPVPKDGETVVTYRVQVRT
ncbi:MAG: DUF4139 domain-containing protein [Candidatus Hydrogenedentes bacterium]|nr:DUF4139 domain-containing protein [Candidatus Hydrogenedentota bacterium]